MTYRERIEEVHRHCLALAEESTTPEWREFWSQKADKMSAILLTLSADSFIRPESV